MQDFKLVAWTTKDIDKVYLECKNTFFHLFNMCFSTTGAPTNMPGMKNVKSDTSGCTGFFRLIARKQAVRLTVIVTAQ